jgi:pimeloyl-ACP methyl ester carboxylesterase
MATMHVNGVDLAYDEVGEGSPLVLLHAGIADRRMWDDALPALSARHRVVRLDLRGFGETPLPDGPFVYAADIQALLDALGIAGADVVGVSMGGHVALDLALAHPQLVDRLILVGAGIDGWKHDEGLVAAWEEEEAALERGDLDEAAWVNVRTWLDGPARGPEAVDSALRRKVFEMQRLALAHENPNATGGWLTPGRRERLGGVRARTLVLVGELDQPDFGRIARFLADAIPGARFEELPGVAHLPPMEDPETFTSVVLAFLDEHARA